jgi:hypothetical protein
MNGAFTAEGGFAFAALFMFSTAVNAARLRDVRRFYGKISCFPDYIPKYRRILVGRPNQREG